MFYYLSKTHLLSAFFVINAMVIGLEFRQTLLDILQKCTGGVHFDSIIYEKFY